ncbi:MAG: tyrosine--tRNA ligase [Cellvibrionaceae bacterium]|nr:tyrosine--tRNA ligase [Cellvibrionaceae bacterium]
MGLIAELRARGLVAQMTGEEALIDVLKTPQTLYCGFDPTASSLHIGSLVPLLTLKRFQQAGHKPIALIGGATGLIGDPSFKSQERQLNTPDVVADWVAGLQAQVSRFIDFDCGHHSAQLVNNLEWTANISTLDFLRKVGKHFSVNNMVNKESVKQRIAREGAGISFTEFSYMLLQSYDFAELNRRYNCTLQIGGSDQWGNIVGGVELSRRLNGAQVYGLTQPLVTKSDGTKFGKTESGTVWLDSTKTSPYAFYQFWLNTADADVYNFLHYFTFLDLAHLAEIERADKQSSAKPQAQYILAEEITRLVHGGELLAAAKRITEALFSGSVERLTAADLRQLALDGLPSTQLKAEDLCEPLTTLFVKADLAKGGKQVKDALLRNAVVVNGEALSWDDNMCAQAIFSAKNALHQRWFLVRLGKKNYHLFDI